MTANASNTDTNGPAFSSMNSSSGPDEFEEGKRFFLDLLIILAKRKWIIFWTTAITASLSIVIALLLPLRYVAEISLLPPQQNSSIGSAIASQLGSLGGVGSLAGSSLGLKNSNDMYIALFRSRSVEESMVQRFNLMQQYHSHCTSLARSAFERHSTVDGSGKDGLIRITVSDTDPKRAAELANGYVEEYRKLSSRLAISEAAQRRLFFEQQLDNIRNDLVTAEEALKNAEQKTGFIQLDSQARAQIQAVAALRAQAAAKEVQIEAIRTYAAGQNAQLAEANQELAALREQLAKLGGDSSSDAPIVSQGSIPEAGLEYARRVRDIKYDETIFEVLARQYELAKLDEAKQGTPLQVIDVAVPPEMRSFPKRGYIVLGSTIGGFVLGIMISFLVTGWRYLLRDPETLSRLRLFVSLMLPRLISGNPEP